MKPFFIFLIVCSPALCIAQEEGSATVSAINSNTLMLDNCIDENGSFKVNQKIIIIQKEGAAALTNGVAKTISSRQVAKKYIVLTITDVDRDDKVVNSIKVSRDLQHSFIINNVAAVDVHVVTCKWNW